MGIKWNEIFVGGDPLLVGSQIAIVLTVVAIVVGLTYFKKWGWLWREWLTTVDHKKIGIMYILSGVLMFFRGGMDGLLMKAQTARPEMNFLDAQHYNEIFTTHGVIMILFMAMPFLIGLMNVVVPLQIGARDVAFPQLNALSFWLFFSGAMLFNISFVVGGSPDAGWTSYFPLAGKEFSPGIGNNYYAIALQIAGLGTLMTGINFIVTILKMRAPGMTLMKMPMFTWTTLITSIIIVAAFPIFTVALALMTFDRLYGTHFFTLSSGGSDMLWANLFWLWGHPEVYIVILPAFGIFSEVIATFSRKTLYGYTSMVISIVGIAFLSMLVWVHHFYDGCEFPCGKLVLLDYNDVNCCSNRSENFQLAIYDAKRTHSIYNSDVMGACLCAKLRHRWRDGGHVGDGSCRLSVSQHIVFSRTLPLRVNSRCRVCGVCRIVLLVAKNVWFYVKRETWKISFLVVYDRI